MSSTPDTTDDPAGPPATTEPSGPDEPVVTGPSPHDPGRLLFVDQLRAAAALYVALYHAMLVLWPNGGPRPPWYLRWTDFGHVSVSIFIVVSGYSLALGPARRGRTSAGSYRTFMTKRARRLLPPYWVALTASIVILAMAPHSVTSGATGEPGDFSKGAVPAKSIVAFFLLVHDFFKVPSPNSPLWSIAVEWHLYFLFPVLLFLGCRYGMAKLIAGTVAVGVGLHFLLHSTSAIGTTPHFLALFSFGIASAYAVARRPPADGTALAKPATGWALIAAAAISFGFLAKWEVGGDLLAGALVAVALWVLGSHPPALPRARRSPGAVLADVGMFSYSLYLVHSPAEKIVWKFAVSKLGLSRVESLAVLTVTGIGAGLAGAWVLFLLVERPAMRWSKQAGRPHPAPAP